MIRSPLSLGLCENNILSSYTNSSSGSVSYRYPEANRCGQLSFDAENSFRDIRNQESAVFRKLIIWTVFSIATPIVAAVASRRLSVPLVVISALFFFTVCLVGAIRSFQAMRNVREQDNEIYRQAEILINDVSNKLAFNVMSVFPVGSVQNGELTESVVVDETLKNNLNQFIDSLRLVHGWTRLSETWRQRPQRSYNGSEESKRRFLVDESFVHLSIRLGSITRKAEQARGYIEGALSLTTEFGQAKNMRQAFLIASGEMLKQIQAWDQERLRIRESLISLDNTFRGTQAQ